MCLLLTFFCLFVSTVTIAALIPIATATATAAACAFTVAVNHASVHNSASQDDDVNMLPRQCTSIAEVKRVKSHGNAAKRKNCYCR